MSHLTDEARAPFRAANSEEISNPNSLEAIVAANPSRRSIIAGGLLGLSAVPLYALATSRQADAGKRADMTIQKTPGGTADVQRVRDKISYEINFTSVPANQDDRVTVPTGYTSDVLLKAGDAVEAGVAGYSGSYPTPAVAEKWAGGNHDGMEYFTIPGIDPNSGGLLAINFEYPDFNILQAGPYNAATATADQKAIALSAVGIAVVEVAKVGDGNWEVKTGSRYNKRYTGNSSYLAGGPAAAVVGNVKGMLNNCASGRTPWGTYLTCEESTDNYLDPTQPATGYGWVIEIDPLNELAAPTKRTALGRFDHENVAYMENNDRRLAFYMGDDGTPGCVYKFVPSRAYSTRNRAANANLLDNGTLYVARYNADGTGEWRALVQGQNGLIIGASDPGDGTQSTTPSVPTTVNFANQADVLINTKSAARVAGGTVMDRPEWITVAPDNRGIFVALTNNSGRQVTNPANPRVVNRHGHILKMRESGDSPLSTGFTWEMFLLAGDPSLAAGGANLTGNINGDTFSSPDGIRIDPQGRLWVQTDHSVPGNSGVAGRSIDQVFGHNAMFYVNQETKESKRFLVGPLGCEITGLAYTPDLKTFFVNIQHPTGSWPVAGEQPRSSTIAVTRTDGKPVGN